MAHDQQPDRQVLWRDLCDAAQWFCPLHEMPREYPNHRRMAVLELEALVEQFRAWELDHPDYRPGPTYGERCDVAGVLHLLRFTLVLAKEAEVFEQSRRATAQREAADRAWRDRLRTGCPLH